MAYTVLLPTSKASVGEPPERFKLTTSLKLTLTVAVSPSFRYALRMPVELLSAMLEMVGASVSRVRLGVPPALPLLPAASW